MAAVTEQKYYWIKLKTDFFNDNSPFDAMMGMEEGSQYVCLYLKLCMMTANNDGIMARQFGEMLVPYDVEKIKRDAKYFSIDTVRVGLEMFARMGLIYRQEDNVFRISNYEEIVGSETKYAEKMRKYRSGLEKRKEGYIVANNVGDNVRQEIRDKSIDNRIQIGENTHTDIPVFIPPTQDELDRFVMDNHLDFDTEKFIAYYSSKNWKIGSEPMADWMAAARMWSYGDEQRKQQNNS